MSARVLSQPRPPEARLKRLLIYNTKHTSCSAKQRKMPVCVCVCVRLAVVRSEAVVAAALNKTSGMH